MDKSYIPLAAEELYTMNLIAVYQDESLTGLLSDADRYDLQNTILTRVGAKDA